MKKQVSWAERVNNSAGSQPTPFLGSLIKTDVYFCVKSAKISHISERGGEKEKSKSVAPSVYSRKVFSNSYKLRLFFFSLIKTAKTQRVYRRNKLISFFAITQWSFPNGYKLTFYFFLTNPAKIQRVNSRNKLISFFFAYNPMVFFEWL